jgi:hypothetical protein
MIAHVGPVPLEELLALAPGAGAAVLMARAWVLLHLRRRRGSGGRQEGGTAPVRRAVEY